MGKFLRQNYTDNQVSTSKTPQAEIHQVTAIHSNPVDDSPFSQEVPSPAESLLVTLTPSQSTLTSTSTSFRWMPKADAAFNELKHRFISALVLIQPDTALQFISCAAVGGPGSVLTLPGFAHLHGPRIRINATTHWHPITSLGKSQPGGDPLWPVARGQPSLARGPSDDPLWPANPVRILSGQSTLRCMVKYITVKKPAMMKQESGPVSQTGRPSGSISPGAQSLITGVRGRLQCSVQAGLNPHVSECQRGHRRISRPAGPAGPLGAA
ncbi:unnamed protein product [Merluccius merluccius]